jgi:diadenosine tetraphosphate (Ap4A) HIT family hydrolase
LNRGEIKSLSQVVAETKNFEVRQDYEIPISGFMILSSKKHLKGIGDFNEEERKEYIDFLFKIRKIMSKVLNIDYVYFIQEEDSIEGSSHFHVWLFPRFDWMSKFGNGIESVRPIMEYARKSMKNEKNLEDVKRVALEIKKEF